MQLGTRRILDKAFSGLGLVSVAFLAAALVILLAPIISRGVTAFFFKGTIEYRRMILEKFGRGDEAEIQAALAAATAARAPIYKAIDDFERELKADFVKRRKYESKLNSLKQALTELLGPMPGDQRPVQIHKQYGQTRWDRAQVKLKNVLCRLDWRQDPKNPQGMLVKTYLPRVDEFRGTTIEPIFSYIENNIKPMLDPKFTFYWRFLFDESKDAHFFGGIWPEMIGTIYLTIGAMLFSVPIGVISAIYLVEYAADTKFLTILRTCISTLAGVPSIVFGLFGLAFFINAMKVSHSKSVLVGSMTLGLLVLPIIIRASEEAIRAVPQTYKEAALSLGAGRWWTIISVILPAALPGILTGIVISMGRAAGETAPIIFTAAVSVGRPLTPVEALTNPTPALPWNIYNLATEHQAIDEIRHVQFGMVLTLVVVVLLLNAAALILRARVSKKLKG